MIKKLTIKRFKSIRDLSISCKRVNLFIGEPDTGKTNILEALNFLSRLGWNWPIDRTFRVHGNTGFNELFHRQFFDRPIEIRLDGFHLRASVAGQDRHLDLQCSPNGQRFTLGFNMKVHLPELSWIRFYSYTSSAEWQYSTEGPEADKIVVTPNGPNLLYLAQHHGKANEFLKEVVSELDWKVNFDPTSKRFNLSEIREDEILNYGLELLSDSLKRYFFYGVILLTSTKATLVFDEPDVFAFPPYPKLLAEIIARNRSNQFFLTTHNPYFLAALAEKTPGVDLNIFICYRGGESGTQVRLLTRKEVSGLIEQGAAVFFNLKDYAKS